MLSTDEADYDDYRVFAHLAFGLRIAVGLTCLTTDPKKFGNCRRIFPDTWVDARTLTICRVISKTCVV